MKHNSKRILSALLMIALLLSLCSIPAIAAEPEVTVSAKVETVSSNTQNPIYKLVVSARSENGISVMSTVISYDKSVIVPVNRTSLADITGIANGASFTALKSVLKDSSGLSTYSLLGYYYSGTSRDAFLCDLYSTDPIESMTEELAVIEFYFRMADGKNSDDLTNHLFRVETDKAQGSFLAAIYQTPASLAGASGLGLTDKASEGDMTFAYSGNAANLLGFTIDCTVKKAEEPASVVPGGSGSGAAAVHFDDVPSDAWYYEAVMFLAEKGITNGTSVNQFSPNAALTRAQFLVLIMRAYEIEPEQDSANNFRDAGDTYYTGYLAAAKRLGIADGIGDNQFVPERACSRQEMFKLVYGALRAVGKLPEATGVKAIDDFDDGGKIAVWAVQAIEHLVSAGLIGGTGKGLLDLFSGSTRAQMAQLLTNILKQ